MIDVKLDMCININIADVPYIYIKANSISTLDHFLVSQYLEECVLECSIIENHLHSDHVAVTITFDIDVVHNTVSQRCIVTRIAWLVIMTVEIQDKIGCVIIKYAICYRSP